MPVSTLPWEGYASKTTKEQLPWAGYTTQIAPTARAEAEPTASQLGIYKGIKVWNAKSFVETNE